MSDSGTPQTSATICTRCGTSIEPGEQACRSCGTTRSGAGGTGTTAARGEATQVAAGKPAGTGSDPNTPMTYPAGERTDGFRSGAAPETPVEAEPERFEEAGPGTLSNQGPLLDEDGDDIRQYTGEPVETEDGWVLPMQQNFAGKDNIAGGGEWPDPDTPPTQPSDGAEDPASEEAAPEQR